MAKSFNELRAKMSPEQQKQGKEKAAELMAEMPLFELRKAFSLTQTQVAETLHMSQAAVSKMEAQTDMYLSTLRRFIAAMGGELKIIASFPQGNVVIDQFVTNDEESIEV